jgi:hypothetical protein
MTYVDVHTAHSEASAGRAWEVVSRLGGDERIYVPALLWRARGRLERLVGGPGHRIAGPSHAGRLRPGDAVDFWDVVEVDPPTRLRLRALSLLPGTAHLDITVRPDGEGSQVRLRTEFEPTGALGHVFWWAELPAHVVVFELMTRRLAALVADA